MAPDLAESRLLIRDVEGFPEPDIIYKDITPLLGNGPAFASVVMAMAAPWINHQIDAVVGMEARGFLFGAPVALGLGAGFVPVRKPGKLPMPARSESYSLEYGANSLELHDDSLTPDSRVLVIDDVLATGGTAAATARLVASTGAQLVGFGFLLELVELAGRTKLGGYHIETVFSEGSR